MKDAFGISGNSFGRHARIGALTEVHAGNGDLVAGRQQRFYDLGSGAAGQVYVRPPEGKGAAACESLHVLRPFRGQVHAAVRQARRKGLRRAIVQFVTLGEGDCFTAGWDDAARWLISRPFLGKAKPIDCRAVL